MDNKIIKDSIYGHIPIPSICLSFMDVPEFQRLRRVSQLGNAKYAYPSAVHTRFEHSIGVMYLAGKMVNQLQRYTTIDERTKHLIQLAGLYHDIGHFSYSHLFDTFLSKIRYEDIPYIFTLKHHEDRSLYFLHKVNQRLKLLSESEEQFVSHCIQGFIPDGCSPYLYEIISNKLCNIDVDRLDYLHRDSSSLGFPAFQSDYIIYNVMIDKDGHIGFNAKIYGEIRDFFDTRIRMFENVYLHHTSRKVDKIYFCMMKRLGQKLFNYGEKTDDYNIETLIRTSDETSDLVLCLDSRQLNHDCEICHQFQPSAKIRPSAGIESTKFI